MRVAPLVLQIFTMVLVLRCLAEEVFDLFLIFDFARVDLALVDTVEGRRDLFRERADLVAIVCRCSVFDGWVRCVDFGLLFLSDSDFEGLFWMIDRCACPVVAGKGNSINPPEQKIRSHQ